MDDNTIICRCEISPGGDREQLDKVIQQWMRLNASPAGMGPCQENLSEDSITCYSPLLK